jgi:hypothetical protein
MKLLIAALTMFSVSAFAHNHYGEAGCGLGTMVMGQNGNQILAATTNGTSGSQTFGITSGTSNCTDHGAVKASNRIPMYIEVNKLALAKEASRGQGEAIAGLAALYGCDDKKMGAALKANYNQVFEETQMNPSAIRKNIDDIAFDQACGG